MNILLINHYAGTLELGMEFRPYYLAKEWVSMGHNVTIIAASFSHLRRQNPEVISGFQEEMIDGIRYVWIKTPTYEGNGLGRIKNMFFFLKGLSSKVKYLANTYKPDVVIASSTYPNDNYFARKISKIANAKYIWEVNDLWPLSPMELGGMSRFHPFIMFLKRGELFAYKNIDAAVSLLPNTEEYMKSQGLGNNKWHYIPNGIVVEDWQNKVEVSKGYSDVFDKLHSQGKTIIGYTGGHAISNSLNTIIDAAKMMEDSHKSIHFVFIGDGQEKQNLIKQAAGLNNITFLAPVSKGQIPSILELMDILIITWNKSAIYRFGISPNKIFDYMMSQKPIIHATDAPNKFVDVADCGIAIEPQNSLQIVDAINELKLKSPAELEIMGRNGKKYILANHDYKVLAANFINIINNI
ncbi:MAG: glycosyltransferase family 4 protein [Bacteroidales bacterium]|nr:glycosyltransferase family 4 protein [Bacteroidales bacterium]